MGAEHRLTSCRPLGHAGLFGLAHAPISAFRAPRAKCLRRCASRSFTAFLVSPIHPSARTPGRNSSAGMTSAPLAPRCSPLLGRPSAPRAAPRIVTSIQTAVRAARRLTAVRWFSNNARTLGPAATRNGRSRIVVPRRSWTPTARRPSSSGFSTTRSSGRSGSLETPGNFSSKSACASSLRPAIALCQMSAIVGGGGSAGGGRCCACSDATGAAMGVALVTAGGEVQPTAVSTNQAAVFERGDN